MEDESEQSVTGIINALSEVSQDADELSRDAALALMSLSSSAVDSASSLSLSVSSASTLLETLDSVSNVIAKSMTAEGGRRLATDNSVMQLMSVLQAYSDFVAGSMLPGQIASSSVQDNFRLTSQYTSGDHSLSLPQSSLEVLTGFSVSSVTLPPSSSAATAVSLMTLLPSVYGGSGDSASFNSNPFNVMLSALPCSSSLCELTIVLQNSRSVSLSALNNHVPEYVNTTCVKGVHTVVNHTCANGLTLQNITCTGLSNYFIESRCPNVTYSQVCSSLSGATANSDSGCRLLSQSSTNITCSCLIGTASSRRLQNTTNDDTTDTYSVGYVSMLEAVAHSFESNIRSAQGLNANTVEKSWKALVTIGTFAVAILVAMLLSYRADENDKEADKKAAKLSKKEQKHQDHVHRFIKSGHVAPLVINSRSTNNRGTNNRVTKNAARKQKVNVELLMVEQSLPNILSSSISLQQRVLSELRQKHRWFGVIFFYSESFPRVLRVASLATNVIIMLFIQSITYNLTNPDDGTCTTHSNQNDCERDKSPFATGESKCHWSSDNTCYFVQPSDSIKIVLFVAIFSAIVSTPIALTADWMLQKLISAPVKKQNHIFGHYFDHEDHHDAQEVVVRGSEKTSPTHSMMRLSDRVTKRNVTSMAHYQMELTNLSNEVRAYRETLTKTQRAEFDLLWGLDEHGSFKTGTAGEAKSLTSKSVNVHQAVLADLKKIGERVEKELIRFPVGGSTKADVEKNSLTPQQKKFNRELGKRLLFLFQCDLLPGISGKILQSKGSRDNVVTKPVSRAVFWTSCSILVLANAGMLFYIFLFAINQNMHRQSAWFQSFIIWLIVEIIFVSTLVATVTHVIIPLLSMKDVTKIKQRLLDNIRDFYGRIADNKLLEHGEDGVKPFNAAKYLFVSTRLAALHPVIRESGIIGAFSTPWPKQSYQHFTDVTKSYSKKFTSINRSVVFVVLFFITNMLNIPHVLQDMFLQLTSTSAIGYTAFLHIQLYNVFPLLVIVPFVVICVLVHFIIQSGRAGAKKRLAQLMPLNNTLVHAHDQPKGEGEVVTIRKSLVHVDRRKSIVQGLGVIKQMHDELIDNDEDEGNSDSEEEKQMEKDDEGNVVVAFSEASLSRPTVQRKAIAHKKTSGCVFTFVEKCEKESDSPLTLSPVKPSVVGAVASPKVAESISQVVVDLEDIEEDENENEDEDGVNNNNSNDDEDGEEERSLHISFDSDLEYELRKAGLYGSDDEDEFDDYDYKM